jgi:hypothetical protein
LRDEPWVELVDSDCSGPVGDLPTRPMWISETVRPNRCEGAK